MIKMYDGGILSEEDRYLLMKIVVAQHKDYNTRSRVVKGAGPRAKLKAPLLSNIPKEVPKKYKTSKGLGVPNKIHTSPHSQTVKNPVLSDEFVSLPSNVSFPKYSPYDIAQVLSQIKFSAQIIEFLRIPEHKKMAFEYLGLKEEKSNPCRNVNIRETPPIIEELETPPALEELYQPSEVYL